MTGRADGCVYYLKKEFKMTDKLRPTDSQTEIFSANGKSDSAPKILKVVDDRGRSIKDGGRTKSRTFTLTGSTADDQALGIADKNTYLQAHVSMANGEFKVSLENQELGAHLYYVRGAESALPPYWQIEIVPEDYTYIDSISDSGNREIHEGGSTSYSSLIIVGFSQPETSVGLLHNGRRVQNLEVAPSGEWRAKVEGLQAGPQRFTAWGINNQISDMRIVVVN